MLKMSKSGVNTENANLIDQPDPLGVSSVETLQVGGGSVPPTESTENHNYQKSRVELVDVSRRFDCISHQLDQTSYQRLHHLVSHFRVCNFFRFKLKLQLPVFSPRLELTPADSTCTEIFNFLSIFSFKT